MRLLHRSQSILTDLTGEQLYSDGARNWGRALGRGGGELLERMRTEGGMYKEKESRDKSMRLRAKRLEANADEGGGYLWLRLVRRKAFWRAAKKNACQNINPLPTPTRSWLDVHFTFDTQYETPNSSSTNFLPQENYIGELALKQSFLLLRGLDIYQSQSHSTFPSFPTHRTAAEACPSPPIMLSHCRTY